MYSPHYPQQLRYFLLAVVFALAACAQLGLNTPDTTAERIAAAKATATQVVTTTTTLLNAKAISSLDAENALRVTDAAMGGITTVQTLLVQDPVAANQRLAMITATLGAVQVYLASKQPK